MSASPNIDNDEIKIFEEMVVDPSNFVPNGEAEIPGEDGSWSISVADAPSNNKKKYTIYIHTPKQRLTLMRAVQEITDLHAKLRSNYPGTALPSLPGFPTSGTNTGDAKRRSSFLSTLSRITSPKSKPVPNVSQLSGVAPSAEEASEIRSALAAYLTLVGNHPIFRRSRAWRRFVRERTDDLSSVHAEHMVKRVRSESGLGRSDSQSGSASGLRTSHDRPGKPIPDLPSAPATDLLDVRRGESDASEGIVERDEEEPARVDRYLSNLPNLGSSSSQDGSDSGIKGTNHDTQLIISKNMPEKLLLDSPAMPTRQGHGISAFKPLEEKGAIPTPSDEICLSDCPLIPIENPAGPIKSNLSDTSTIHSPSQEVPSSPSTGSLSPVSDKHQRSGGVADALQIYTPQYLASVMFESLMQHGCPNLTSLVDPLGFSSSAVAEGGFGDVWTGRLHTGDKLAIKLMRFTSLADKTGKKRLKRATREIYNWSKLDHENVNKLMGVIMFRERLGMVSKWMEHGNLRQYLDQNSNVDRHQLCAQIANGVAYIHGVNMVHGDLKAYNILVSSSGVIKITDFDYSIVPECSIVFSATTRIAGGTFRWMAPELLLNEDPPQRNTKTDIYALGMTFFETITNTHPYPDCRHDTQVLLRLIRKNFPVRSVDYFPDSKWGNQIWSLLVQCWDYNPAARPTASDILALLSSPEV